MRRLRRRWKEDRSEQRVRLKDGKDRREGKIEWILHRDSWKEEVKRVEEREESERIEGVMARVMVGKEEGRDR